MLFVVGNYLIWVRKHQRFCLYCLDISLPRPSFLDAVAEAVV